MAENPKAVLYHVTSSPNAELIRRHGFRPLGIPHNTESPEVAATAREILPEDERESVGPYDPHDPEREARDKLPLEVRVREAVTAMLDYHRPPDNPFPSHGLSNFFLSDEATARDMAGRPGAVWPREVLTVDASKIPCKCFMADRNLSNKLFKTVYEYPRWSEAYAALAPDPPDVAPGLWEGWFEEHCEELAKLADSYYATMRPYDGTRDPNIEVLCPCRIPPTAIMDGNAPSSRHRDAGEESSG